MQGWEGFFNTSGTTTITEDIFLLEYPSRDIILTFQVTLNATHLKPCLEIEYSNISRYFDIQYNDGYYPYYDAYYFDLHIDNIFRQPTNLDVFSTGKSIVIMHAGIVDNIIHSCFMQWLCAL